MNNVPQLLVKGTLLDIRVVDTDADSIVILSSSCIIKSAEEEKNSRGNTLQYGYVGVTSKLVNCVLRRVAEVLSWRWVRGWVRSTLSLAVIRATGLCLQESRVPWRSGKGFEDSVGLYAALTE